eukprot:gene9337-14474_t
MENRAVKPEQSLGFTQLVGLLFVAAIGGAYGMEDCVRTGGGLWTMIDAWISSAFPPWFAVMSILWTFFVNRMDNSLYPNLFVDYLTNAVDLSNLEQAFVKVAFVVACTGLNIAGVEFVGKASAAILFLTTLPFFLMFFCELKHLNTDDLWSIPEKGVEWTVFLPMIAWNISGFDSAGHIMEEVNATGKEFVRAMVVLLVLTEVVYIMPVLAGVSAQARRGYSGTSSDSGSGFDLNSTTDYADWTDGYWVTIADWIDGEWLKIVTTVGALMSATGFMCSLLCTTSRALQGHAMLGIFPEPVNVWLRQLHPTFKTPVHAIIVNSALCLTLSLTMTFDTLVNIDQVLYSLRLMAILTATYVLRQRHPLLPRPYVIPLSTTGLACFIVLPVGFCLVCIVFGAVADAVIFGVSVGVVIFSALVSMYLSRTSFKDGLDARI